MPVLEELSIALSGMHWSLIARDTDSEGYKVGNRHIIV